MCELKNQKKRFEKFFNIKLPSIKSIHRTVESGSRTTEYMLFSGGSTIVFGIPNRKVDFYHKEFGKKRITYDKYFIIQYHNTSKCRILERWYPKQKDGPALQKFINWLKNKDKNNDTYNLYKTDINSIHEILKDVEINNRVLIGGKDV